MILRYRGPLNPFKRGSKSYLVGLGISGVMKDSLDKVLLAPSNSNESDSESEDNED